MVSRHRPPTSPFSFSRSLSFGLAAFRQIARMAPKDPLQQLGSQPRVPKKSTRQAPR
jgi:hypothetical protein